MFRVTPIPKVPSIRRLAAALFSILLLQLTLLGSGTLCASDARASHDMAGMAAHTTPASHDGTTPRPCNESPVGCRLPWAPGQCASMSACIVTTMPATTVALYAGPSHVASWLPEPATIGSRAGVPPEPPPPRA